MSSQPPPPRRRPLSELRPKALYVDDDASNLLVFAAGLKKHVDVRTASSAAEGLEILEREEIPVIIADQRMPGMSGSDFLGEVEQRFPSTMRMIMTAYTSFQDAVDAVNKGRAIRFLKKPWKSQDLLIEIKNAAELYYRIQENEILRDKLMARERLAAIGQLTSGLVHELSNIAAILSSIEDVRFEVEEGGDAAEPLADFRTGVRKFSLLLETLRTASNTGELQLDRRAHDLRELIESSVGCSRVFSEIRKLRRFEVAPQAAPLVALVDGPKIEQAVLNLVKNAAEACPPNTGDVRIELLRVSDRAQIIILDNGPGIPPELAAKIFRGFYTTKGNTGTGLGLVMSRRIVEAHRGTLSFADRPGGGCRFVIELPIREARPSSGGEGSPPVAPG